MLLLVEDGRLSLSDDIRKHLPELPDYGHTVTVDHLLTHTGGIRDWTGMLPLAPEGTDVVSLIHAPARAQLRAGRGWSYSSSGFELAKEIVARVSGMSFAEFTRKRLFEPLGMKSSAYVPDIMQAGPNAALGYQKEGAGWKQYMRLGNNRGGGAIVEHGGRPRHLDRRAGERKARQVRHRQDHRSRRGWPTAGSSSTRAA